MTSSFSCHIFAIQLLVWWGLFFAERALQIRQGPHAASRLGRYMILEGAAVTRFDPAGDLACT